MPDTDAVDYYETLQISPNADPDMVHRVYRLLAQRFHPDNADSGNATRFRELHEAYTVLSDPEKRAEYDVAYHRHRSTRAKLVFSAAEAENDFGYEQAVRLTVLEVLYTHRRNDPRQPGLFDRDLEELIGRPMEQLEFTFWYLTQRNLVKRGDTSRLLITVEGVDYLEQHYEHADKKRLRGHIEPV